MSVPTKIIVEAIERINRQFINPNDFKKVLGSQSSFSQFISNDNLLFDFFKFVVECLKTSTIFSFPPRCELMPEELLKKMLKNFPYRNLGEYFHNPITSVVFTNFDEHGDTRYVIILFIKSNFIPDHLRPIFEIKYGLKDDGIFAYAMDFTFNAKDWDNVIEPSCVLAYYPNDFYTADDNLMTVEMVPAMEDYLNLRHAVKYQQPRMYSESTKEFFRTGIITTMSQFVSISSCKNIEYTKKFVPSKLNKKRKKRGVIMYPDYYQFVLIGKGKTRVTKSLNSLADDLIKAKRKSPKVHWRDSHIRMHIGKYPMFIAATVINGDSDDLNLRPLKEIVKPVYGKTIRKQTPVFV